MNRTSFLGLALLALLSTSILAQTPPPANDTSDSLALARAKETNRLQTAHTIYLLFYYYALDNNGDYPTGKSSTEVFQKLINAGYITDSSIFYFDMPGKVKPTSNTLKPENVCWDVSAPVSDSTPDDIPVVFITGFKISYKTGGTATLLAKPAVAGASFPVTFKDGSSKVLHTGADGTTPDVLSEKLLFPEHQTYTQLTPDGPLKP